MECHYKTTLSDYIILTLKAFPQNEKDTTHVHPFFSIPTRYNNLKFSNPADMDSISLTSLNSWEVASDSEIIAVYRTRRLIAVFTRPCHWTLPEFVESNPHLI